MKRNKWNEILGALCMMSGLVMSGCQDEGFIDYTPQQEVVNQTQQDVEWLPGEAFVKLKKTATRAAMSSVMESVDASMFDANAQMEPVFEIKGEYAAAMRREGLDRWYKLTFNPEVKVQEVLRVLAQDESVELAHGSLPIERQRVEYTPCPAVRSNTRSAYPSLNNGFPTFQVGDPLLPQQWHYANLGGAKGFAQGADIQLLEAWKKSTGDKRVVVAIIDSGIDVTHPDLQGAMWSDAEGHHGKNFVNDNFELEADYHGTHVGGTVAARNNNGVGVCGIAGGDGSADSGVRLMSCQIFGAIRPDGTSTSAKADQIAKAFIWAVENGAIIANCSWGFPWNPDRYANPEDYTSSLEKAGALVLEGIRFFNKYAGNDAEGKKKPESMMSGGIVIFASGNDSARDIDIIPASYADVVAVGSFTPNFSLANYTNVGRWVDILAPGGLVENFVNGGVLSTVPSNFGSIQIGIDRGSKFLYTGETQYAFANGTSMAAPHVTGITALMVSHFGKTNKNLTSDVIRQRLLGAVKPQSLDKASKETALQGRMGVGFVDAAYALSDPETQAPTVVSDIEVLETGYYEAKIAWKVTADIDALTGTAFAYDLYLAQKNATAKEAKQVGIVYSNEQPVGATLEYELTELESDQSYVVSVVARDRNGNKAEAGKVELKTKLNHKPEIVNPLPEKLHILNTQAFYKYSFEVKDADPNQTWSFETSELPNGVSIVRKGDRLDLTILVNSKSGEFTFDLALTDNLQGKQVYPISYSIVNYSKPEPIAELKDLILFENGNAVKVSLNEVFKVAEGLGEPTFEAQSNVPQVAEVKVENGQLAITPRKKGSTTILVTVNDGHHPSQTSFQVQVTEKNESDIHAIYPTPAHSYLKILVKEGIEEMDVTVTSIRGEVLIHQLLQVAAKDQVATLEVDKLVPGMYNLIVKTNQKTSKRTFVKN